MTTRQPAIPPDVARYLHGPTPESRQFDFLIGDWRVAASLFAPDGSLLRQYTARWEARHLNGGRMVMDDFRAQAPNGEDLSSFVTLRTWSEATGRWEITGLAAFQPAMNARWYGHWQEGEMRLEAVGQDAKGDTVHTRIRFFDVTADTFRWESRMCRDGQASWVKTAALVASRAR